MIVGVLVEAEGTGAAMVRAGIRDIELPDEQDVAQAEEAAARLTDFLRACPMSSARLRLVGEGDGRDSTEVAIPAAVIPILVDALAATADGNAVNVVPVQAEFTTQQAADLLNVSRPYLVKLLDDERIPCRRVGNRRKILLSHLLEYKRRDEAHRQEIADRLTEEAERIGLEY